VPRGPATLASKSGAGAPREKYWYAQGNYRLKSVIFTKTKSSDKQMKTQKKAQKTKQINY